MKLHFRYSVSKLLMGKWWGKCWYPFVLFSKSREDVPDWLFRHEMEHVYQVRRMGWWKFYTQYIYLAMQLGYKKHPFEIEATERQNDPLTKNERSYREL